MGFKGEEVAGDTIGIEILNLNKLVAINDGFAKKINTIFDKYTKSLQGAGNSGGQGGLANKLIIIGQTQTALQQQMALRLSQIATNTANKQMIDYLGKQQKVLDSIKVTWSHTASGNKDGNNLGQQLWTGFKDVMKGMFSGLKRFIGFLRKAWEKGVGKVFKATGQMGINKLLGLGGAAVLGALVGKMISSSPLLQAMFKIMNTSLTLILRPIGDFFGAFLRPMSIYFLKEIAIPFFNKNKEMMKMGEQWGRTALGFFINPGKAIQSAIILGLKDVPFFKAFAGDDVGQKSAVSEANFFQKNPGAWKRWTEGVGDIKGVDTLSPLSWGQEGHEDFIAQGMGGLSYRQFQSFFQGGIPGNEEGDMTGEAKPIGGENPALTALAYLFGPVGVLGKAIGDWWGNIKWEDIFVLTPVSEAAEDGANQITESTSSWADAWDNFTGGISDGADEWGRQISKWTSEQSMAWGAFTKQIQKDTSSWMEWAGKGVEEGWEWITSLGKINEAFADTGKDSEEANKNWVQSITDWIESINVATFGTRVAADGFADSITTAGDKLITTVDIATSSIFGTSQSTINNDHGRGQADTSQGAGDAYTVTGIPGMNVVPSASAASPDDTQHSSQLGQYSDSRFETSPGKFSDIYSGGKKIDPQSEEGKTIQGIYQQQHDTKIKNAEIKAHLTAVKDASDNTGTSGQAYMIGGGGETGLEAINYAKEHGLDMQNYGDIITLADALGLKDHPMIKTAEEGLKAQKAMAEKIMADREAAGQTPSIQGDMLDLYPNAEDSEFGWSDQRLADFKKANENRYISMYDAVTQSGTAITKTTYSDPSTGGSGYVGGINVAPWLSGGTISDSSIDTTQGYSVRPGDGPPPGGGDRTKPNVGGTDTSWGWGFGTTIKVINPITPGGGPDGTTRGGNGGRPSSGVSFASSGHSGSWSGGGFGAANQWGGIIDEPIIGVGQHTGKGWRLGESQHELVTPMSEVGKDGNIYSINIHVGSITKEADYEKLKPLIQRWILEASSRRGMV